MESVGEGEGHGNVQRIAARRFHAIEIVSCSILDLLPHPRLSGRANATVRVQLREVIGGLPAEHTIDMRLLVITEPEDHIDKVRGIVLAKTAKILLRVKGALEGSTGSTPTAPASSEA